MPLQNKYGIHLANREEHVMMNDLLDMGVHNYTVLHGNGWIASHVRDRYPDAHMLLRFYLPNWSERDPREWARECADIYTGWDHITNRVTPANEMNLEHEGGGKTQDWYKRMNAWLMEWLNEWKRHVSDSITYFPAFAPGNQEDGRTETGNLDWAGYLECADSVEAYDVMRVHAYWRSEALPDSPHGGHGLWDEWGRWLAWRFVADRARFFPNKAVFISEAGNFNVSALTTPHEMLYFFAKLYEWPWVIGGTPFVWHSGPEHDKNRWSNNPEIHQAVRVADKLEVYVPGGDENFTGSLELPYPGPNDGEFWPWPDLQREVERLAALRDCPDNGEPPPLPVPPPAPTPKYVDLVGELPTNGEYANRSMEAIGFSVIHHTAGYMEDEEAYVFEIARQHVEDNGWPGIGYHYCVGTDGTVYRTNPAWKISYHAGDEGNDYGIGIAFLGDYRSRHPTDAQMEACRNLLASLQSITPNRMGLVAHRQIRATRCPGEILLSRVHELEQVL